jgi:hypothetical protein
MTLSEAILSALLGLATGIGWWLLARWIGWL